MALPGPSQGLAGRLRAHLRRAGRPLGPSSGPALRGERQPPKANPRDSRTRYARPRVLSGRRGGAAEAGTAGRGRRRRGRRRPPSPGWGIPAGKELRAGVARTPSRGRGQWAGLGRDEAFPEGSGSGFAAPPAVAAAVERACRVRGEAGGGGGGCRDLAAGRTGEWLGGAEGRGGSDRRGGRGRRLGGAALERAREAAARRRRRRRRRRLEAPGQPLP